MVQLTCVHTVHRQIAQMQNLFVPLQVAIMLCNES